MTDYKQIGAAASELWAVHRGLLLYQAEIENRARFPETSAVTNYTDLRNVLEPYVKLPKLDDASWMFSRYSRDFAYPDSFMLWARAQDSRQTRIIVSPGDIRILW